jgi:hypothetical protein
LQSFLLQLGFEPVILPLPLLLLATGLNDVSVVVGEPASFQLPRLVRTCYDAGTLERSGKSSVGPIAEKNLV